VTDSLWLIQAPIAGYDDGQQKQETRAYDEDSNRAGELGPIWRALVAAGPVARISEEPICLVTDDQIGLLRRKKLPFELMAPPNGFRGGQRQ